MALYGRSISSLIDKYTRAGGEVATLAEGGVGYGVTLLHAPEEAKLKTIVITEVYLNEWNSGHKVRCYNKMPKKYENWLEKINNN